MYTAYRLASEYGVIAEVTQLLNNLEVVLVPFVNPDGYVVSLEDGECDRDHSNALVLLLFPLAVHVDAGPHVAQEQNGT